MTTDGRHIAAIVLAAGASRRMGTPKALLSIDGETFLQHVVETVADAGIDDIRIVLGANEESIRESLGWFEGTVLVNPRWADGQITTIRKGIESLEKTKYGGALICSVDHPLISVSLIRALTGAFCATGRHIAVPVFRGRRGHPIVLPRVYFHEVLTAPLDIGLRAVVRAHEHDIVEVPTEEEGVVMNIDTKEEYKKIVNGK
jgi:molybdenum cofactor cytidylyltransferase